MFSPNRAIFPAARTRGARPRADPLLDVGVAPVSDGDLALEAHPGRDEPELPVAVGGLVQVHEVHVDVGPGNPPVELRVQVQEGLAEDVEPGDPHFGRRERVHPGDDAHAGIIGVRLERQPANLVGAGQDGLEDDSHREGRGGIEGCGDRLRVFGDRLEGLGAIEVLAPRDEPDLVGVEIQHC
jgi:hypothetical protein